MVDEDRAGRGGPLPGLFRPVPLPAQRLYSTAARPAQPSSGAIRCPTADSSLARRAAPTVGTSRASLNGALASRCRSRSSTQRRSPTSASASSVRPASTRCRTR
ncbi:hypothetical protein ACW23B_07170 [Streptomyces albidoflavus]